MNRSMKYMMVLLLFAAAVPLYAQKTDTLSLDRAIEMALKNNRLIRISEYKVDENRYKLRQMKSKYLPRLRSEGTYSYSNNVPVLSVDQGSFGVLPGNTPLPPQDFTVLQGKHETYSASITFYQPISQLIKVESGVKVAGSDVSVSQSELQANRQKVLINIKKLYYGLQRSEAELREKQAEVELAKAKLEDARAARQAGKTLDVSVVGLHADVLDKQHDVITCQNKIDDYWYDLKQLTGIKPDETWQIVSADTTVSSIVPGEQDFIQQAVRNNPRIKSAAGEMQKAGYAVDAARKEYLPEIGVFAQYKVQRGIPITPHNMAIVGLSLKWDLFTFGERSNTIKERDAVKEQARLAYEEQQNQLTGEVEKAYRKLRRSRQLIKTAQEAVRLRREQLRLSENQHMTGLGLASVVLDAKASLAKSQADLIGAVIQYKLAKAELEQLAGMSDRVSSEQK